MPTENTYIVVDQGQLADALAELRSYQGEEMAKRLRKGTMAGARALVEPMRTASPVGKRTSQLGKRLRDAPAVTQIRESGQWLGYRVKAKGTQPTNLEALVVRGTKRHAILGKVGAPLGLPWGPRALVVHPGSRPNPYVARVGRANAEAVFTAMAKSIATQRKKAGF